MGVVRCLFVRCATFMETLRWDNFCNFGATLLGFGTLFTNIILLWIRNFEKHRTTPTPQKCPKTPQNTLNHYISFLLFRTAFAESLWIKGSDKNEFGKRRFEY